MHKVPHGSSVSTKGPAEMFTGDVYFDVMRPGDTVYTPPGEWHWHGAAPTHFMTHLAMWEGPDPASGKPETTWGDHVTDDEYRLPDGVEAYA
jgi:quercetin dioxygenase-like cupin family protein